MRVGLGANGGIAQQNCGFFGGENSRSVRAVSWSSTFNYTLFGWEIGGCWRGLAIGGWVVWPVRLRGDGWGAMGVWVELSVAVVRMDGGGGVRFWLLSVLYLNGSGKGA